MLGAQKLVLCSAHHSSSSLDVLSNIVLKNINLLYIIIFWLKIRKFRSLNDLYKSIYFKKKRKTTQNPIKTRKKPRSSDLWHSIIMPCALSVLLVFVESQGRFLLFWTSGKICKRGYYKEIKKSNHIIDTCPRTHAHLEMDKDTCPMKGRHCLSYICTVDSYTG